MTLDLSKPVRTRRGDDVSIITTTANGPYPVIGEYIDVRCIKDSWAAGRWNLAGECVSHDATMTLINVPETVECWTRVYAHGLGMVMESRLFLDELALNGKVIAIAHLRIHPDRQGADMIEIVSVEPVDA